MVGSVLAVPRICLLINLDRNPTLEDQALSRIHRLGQTKEVTTVRFFVRDSFEQEVMKLQESKKSLANIILSHHDNGQVNNNLEELHVSLSGSILGKLLTCRKKKLRMLL